MTPPGSGEETGDAPGAGPAPPPDEGTPRALGTIAALSVVAGSMLGVGIFIQPPEVAKLLGSPWAFLAIWALGGLVALSGAVAYAELGASMPRAGGDVVFQRAVYGPSLAFASGWIIFGAAFTGSIATLAMALARFQIPELLGTPLTGTVVALPGGDAALRSRELVALGLVVGFTLLNAAGVRPAGRTQTLVTLLPFAVLTVLSLAALGGEAPPEHPPRPPAAGEAAEAPGITAWVRAHLAVYFAYAGWNAIVYVAGEVRTPARVVPRSLIGGTLAVTALYLLLCGAFLHVLGAGGLADAEDPGAALAASVLGPGASRVTTALIAIAIAASLNATVLGGARVAWAMARRGAIGTGLARLAPNGVPRRALWLQAALAALFVLTGTFRQVYETTSLAMVCTGSLTVLGVYLLRRRRPDLDRPYRAPGYPWLPALYLLASAVTLGVTLRRVVVGDEESLYAALGPLLLAGLWLGHRLGRRVGRRG